MNYLNKIINLFYNFKFYIQNLFISSHIMNPYSYKSIANSIKVDSEITKLTTPAPISAAIINHKKHKPVFLSTSQLPFVESATAISLTKINNSTTLLKIAIYFQGKIFCTSDSDFIIIINNVLVKQTQARLLKSIGNNHLIQLQCLIPSIYNSSNIYFLLGTNPSFNKLFTRSLSNICLTHISPYIEGRNIKPCYFSWEKSYDNSIIENISYISNIFKYKVPIPLCRYNFGRNFSLLPTEESIVLNVTFIYFIDLNTISNLQIKIKNNYLINKDKDIGSIYINFYLTNPNFNPILYFNKIEKITISLKENNTLIVFIINLPKDFIDSISLIHAYFSPSEYLLMTEDEKSFINSSYKTITTKIDIIEK